MIVKLLTEHHLEFLSLKGGCRGSSESTLVKMPHCWKSHATAHLSITYIHYFKIANQTKKSYTSLSASSLVGFASRVTSDMELKFTIVLIFSIRLEIVEGNARLGVPTKGTCLTLFILMDYHIHREYQVHVF